MWQQPNLSSHELKVIFNLKLCESERRGECAARMSISRSLYRVQGRNGTRRWCGDAPSFGLRCFRELSCLTVEVTYRIPEHVVQTKVPVVMLTYVTPFWPQSKHWRFPPEATTSRRLFSILLSLLSAFGFIIFTFRAFYIFACFREWITKKIWDAQLLSELASWFILIADDVTIWVSTN